MSDGPSTPSRPAPGHGPPHAGRRRRRRRLTGLQRVLVALIAVVSVAIGGLLAVVGWGLYRFEQVERLDLDAALAAPVADGEPMNVLLVGSDRRTSVDRGDPDAAVFLGAGAPEGQRADTIMILRLDPGSARADLLSVPRDLLVELPDGTEGRINAAYVDGAEQLVDTIDAALGVPIHHYVEVEFAAFRDLVDLAGGVHLWFQDPMLDESAGLFVNERGCVLLDGTQALAFARSRHASFSNGVEWVPDPTGDLGRITRQQIFLRRVADEIADLGLGDPRRIDDLLDVAVDHVSLDDRFGLADLRALASRFGTLGGDAVSVHTLPTDAERTEAGAAVLRLRGAEAVGTLEIFDASGRGSAVVAPTTGQPLLAAGTTGDVEPAAPGTTPETSVGADPVDAPASGSATIDAEVAAAVAVPVGRAIGEVPPGETCG